jgi:hypothetical protein
VAVPGALTEEEIDKKFAEILDKFDRNATAALPSRLRSE